MYLETEQQLLIINAKNILQQYPLTKATYVKNSRKAISNIINGKSKQLIAIVGPCSIDDPKAAIEFASKIKPIATQLQDKLQIVMRCYMEKPRSKGGWRGLMLEPDINNAKMQIDLNKGIALARKTMLAITELEIPIAYEFVEPIFAGYIQDCISFATIGARTVSSPTHRMLAVKHNQIPFGFKNTTQGDIQPAIDACEVAKYGMQCYGIDINGNLIIDRESKSNKNCCVILRGGNNGPNYSAKLYSNPYLIDCSHANGGYSVHGQLQVIKNLVNRNDKSYKGFMIESNLFAGKQVINKENKQKYGVSITDPCVSIDDVIQLLKQF